MHREKPGLIAGANSSVLLFVDPRKNVNDCRAACFTINSMEELRFTPSCNPPASRRLALNRDWRRAIARYAQTSNRDTASRTSPKAPPTTVSEPWGWGRFAFLGDKCPEPSTDKRGRTRASARHEDCICPEPPNADEAKAVPYRSLHSVHLLPMGRAGSCYHEAIATGGRCRPCGR